MIKQVKQAFLLKVKIERLQNEGSICKMVELLLHNGACGRLLPGWSKTLLKSLEENSLKEIADAVRPGKLIRLCFVICYKYFLKLKQKRTFSFFFVN